MDPEHAVLFNQIAVDIRESFTDLIDSISKQNGGSLDWWVSSPASRNTFVSPLFHYCCCLALLQELIRANEHVAEITTDSRAFKKIIENYLSKQGVSARAILARVPVEQRLKELVRPIHTLFGLPLKQLFLFLAAKLTRSLRNPLPSGPLTLIDTFIMNGYIEKDRYYPGVLDALSEKEKQHVWIVPHLYGFQAWQYMSIVKRLRKSEINFILKDDYLKFGDYWCLWRHLFRVRKLRIRPSLFCGVDISLLVREELTGFRGVSSSHTSLLNYRFAERLGEADVRLRLVIDWFENQSIDKGWNAGFRRFFPEVETIGYQGFIVSSHYLCMYPTKEERNSKVIPHKVAVIGRGLVRSARRFCADLNVCVAPAIRFQHVWEKRKHLPASNVYTILVALPMMMSDAVHMLRLLDRTADEKTAGVRFWIKPHPAVSQSRIQIAFSEEWPKRFEFTGGDFGDCVEKSNLLISSASSACMETLAKGIPVIVVGNNSGLTHNPMPGAITSDIWRLCYSSEEIERAIQLYRSSSPEKIEEYTEVGREIRQEYFEPVTDEGVREFLGIADHAHERNAK